MSRSRAFRRWTGAAVLAAIVGVGAAGCIAIPVGGYGEPAVAIPAPGVVIAPGPIVVGPGYRRGYYRGGYYGRYGYRRGWRS